MPTASPAFRREIEKTLQSLGTVRTNLSYQMGRIEQLESRLADLVGREDDREVWVHKLTGTWHSTTRPCGNAPQLNDERDRIDRGNYELRLAGDQPQYRKCRFCGKYA